MAPRGRPRKGLSRMDAAIDNMKPYGFDKQLVRTTVNRLLKVYGGDDQWAFIEENGYIVLIDAIIDNQKPDDELQITTEQGVSSQYERAEDPVLQSNIVPPGTLVDSPCNYEAINTVEEAGCSGLGLAAEELTQEVLCDSRQAIGSTEVLCSPPPPATERYGNRWKDIREDQTETLSVVCSDGINSGNQVQPEPGRSNSLVLSPSPVSSSPCAVSHYQLKYSSNVTPCPTVIPSPKPPVSPQPPRKRVPCYGWIDESDEEEPDERAEEPVLQSTDVPSGIVTKCNESGNNIVGEMACSELSSANGEATYEKHGSNKKETEKSEVLCLPPVEGNGNIGKDINTSNIDSHESGNSRSQVLQPCGSNSHVSTLLPTCSPCSIDHLVPLASSTRPFVPSSKPVRRSFPCYGWIGRDGEGAAPTFINLTPRKPVQSQKSSGGINKRKERKSRWDI